MMKGKPHTWIRGVHLYLGLFLSPFALVYSVSVFFLVHSWLPGKPDSPPEIRVVSGLPLPRNLEQLSGRVLIDALQPVFSQAGIHGEAGWIQHLTKERRWVIPLSVPGRSTIVTLDVEKKEARVESRSTGLADASIALHKFPGPHLVQLRGNWFPLKLWGWLADATVLLLAFTLSTGFLLWYVMRLDRGPGLWFLGAGAVTLFGMIYALAF